MTKHFFFGGGGKGERGAFWGKVQKMVFFIEKTVYSKTMSLAKWKVFTPSSSPCFTFCHFFVQPLLPQQRLALGEAVSLFLWSLLWILKSIVSHSWWSCPAKFLLFNFTFLSFSRFQFRLIMNVQDFLQCFHFYHYGALFLKNYYLKKCFPRNVEWSCDRARAGLFLFGYRNLSKMSSKVATAVLMNFSNFCDLKAAKNAFLQFLVAVYIWSKICLKRNGKKEIKSRCLQICTYCYYWT